MGYVQLADLIAADTTAISPPGAPTVDFTLLTTQALQSLIDRAANQIDGYCKQTFQLQNVFERYTGKGTNRLFLRRFPLAQITDSILGIGSFGNVSQSLCVDTTFTQAITQAQITAGINTVQVADISNMLPGQYLQWGDGTSEPTTAAAPAANEIITVAPATTGAVSGPGTITLKGNLTVPHPIPPANVNFLTARIVVNTLDQISLVLPGQAYFQLPLTQFVVDAQKGEIINYTPLMFQNLGYATIFPQMLPLLVRYNVGYLSRQFPPVLQEVNIEQARRIVLRNMDLSAAGIRAIRSGDASINYGEWQPVALAEDLKDYLGPFRRNVGFH